MANLFLEIPRTKDEEEFRRLLNDRLLTIGEELIRLGKEKPLKITADIDMGGFRIANLGDPEKIRVSGKEAALLGTRAAETRQLNHALNIQFADARYLHRHEEEKGGASGNPGTVAYTPTLGPYAMMGFKSFTLTGKADLLHVVIWSIDEASTDLLYGVLGAAMDATTSPVTLSVTVFNKERDGVTPEFAIGDLIAIDDPDQDPDNPAAAPGTIRKYEIATVGTITGSQPGTATIEFTSRGGLGSFKSAHESGRRFYRVRAAHFSVPTKDNAGNDKITSEEFFPISSACVVAMAVAASDVGSIGTWNLTNCSALAYPFPGDPHETNPAPGYRTCNGADYRFLLAGAVSVAQSSGVPLWVGETASIRDVVASIARPPEGSAAVYDGVLASMTDVALVLYILLIEPTTPLLPYRDRRVGILDQIAFKENEHHTFPTSNPPNALEGQRRMPYLPKWPTKTCPVVGTVDSLYDPDTGLIRSNVLPFVAQNDYIDFEEGCQIDAVVARVGSDFAGFNIEVTVLT